MNYSINKAGMLWSSGYFSVPNLVLNYIKLATDKQLKILLLVLSSEKISDEDISSQLKIDIDTTRDIIEYWVSEGIIIAQGNEVKTPATITQVVEIKPILKVEEKKEPSKKIALKDMDIPRLTQKDIIARCKESNAIAGLLSESQVVLGRTISVGEQEMLVNMVDYYGLEPEVILMILDYVKEKRQVRTNYICAIAKEWGESGITTVEKAEQRLNEMSKANKIWKKICIFGELPQKSPTVAQLNYVNEWTIKMAFPMEVIEYAFEKAKDNEAKRIVPYVNGILLKWFKENLKTLNDIQNYENSKLKKSKAENLTGEATYDINEIEKNLISETLNFGG